MQTEARLTAQRRTDLAELERAGDAVQQRHAVQQRARRDGAEHEVLHRGFGGDAVLPVERDQRVQRQRQQLDAEVHGDQVAGGTEHDNAEQRRQRQHVELALLQTAPREKAVRIVEADGDEQIRGEFQHEPSPSAT